MFLLPSQSSLLKLPNNYFLPVVALLLPLALPPPPPPLPPSSPNYFSLATGLCVMELIIGFHQNYHQMAHME